jgi:cytochrome o ubiquinol oxidase operon protein cyoD
MTASDYAHRGGKDLPARDEEEARHAVGSDQDEAPGDGDGDISPAAELAKLGLGLALALVLTLASFWAAGSSFVWAPAVPVMLAALAIGQMGVHLVFFLHISSGPEGSNNILALAFGVFVVRLVVFGSMVIMANLDSRMMPMSTLQSMQR